MNIKKNKYKRTGRVHRGALIGGSASILMTLFAPSAIAQEVKNAIDGEAKDDGVEVIEVSGVRASLEDALNVKREASSIVDAISASDIDALPALDLGEALQALPGIQLNTDDGTRNSEINLRGLSGGFVRTTAEGQGFATPSRSFGAVGGSNPFGAFEAGVFDGVTIVKSPTADMQEGGIAGIIDKKLQRALGKRDGVYAINLGTRYEELSDQLDNKFSFSGSKHIIKDKLAIAWKMAGSEQNFRRDTVNFSSYNALNTVTGHSEEDTTYIKGEDLQAYKDLHGITDPLAIIKVVGRAQQVTENSRGDRFSATGNIEYQVTDALKVGMNLLYTKRDLGASTQEDFNIQMHSRDDQNFISQVVTLSDDINDTPIRLSDNPNPQYNPDIHHPDLATIPVYAATTATISNVTFAPATRLLSYKEEAKGVFLYADYIKDDWTIDGTVTRSESSNEFQQAALDVRLQNRTWGRYTDLDSGERLRYAPTGLTGFFNTGKGDLSVARVEIEGLDNFVYSDVNGILPALDPEDAWQRTSSGWNSVRLSSNSSLLDPKLNPLNPDDFPEGTLPEDPEERQAKLDEYGNKSVQFFSVGRVHRPEREVQSGELNFKRFTDIGNDAFLLTSVKFGGRHSREKLDTFDVSVGAGGVDTSVLNRETLFSSNLDSASQAEFFNGDYPNQITNETGWLRIDSENLKGLLQGEALRPYDTDGNLVEEFDIAHPTGYAVKLDHRTDEPTFGLNQLFRNNFSADQVINAVYVMGEFEGTIADFEYSGNMGVRYIETTNDIIGQGFDDEGLGIAVITENDYSHTLPVVNLSVELTDDIVVRTAYSKGMVRPNLLAQSPSPRFDNSGSRARLENSKAEVVPYTSENFDLSLEWYNREGSAVALGIFRKDIEGKIQTSTICPIGDEARWDVGPLEEVDVGGELPRCQEIEPFETDEGDIVENREVIVRSTFNSDIPITVNGYELSVQQKLDFLPYPWNGFGGVFNFTKIDLDDGDGQPMTRIAPYSYNLIGYYENDGFSIRLAYNWQDEKLLSAGGNNSFLGSEARTQSAGGRLDMSASYKITKKLRFNVRAFNLNNRQQFEFIGGNEEAISRIRYAGRTYSASLSYRF